MVTLVPFLTMATQRKAIISYAGAGMPEDMDHFSHVIYAYDLTCTYQPHKRSKCAKNLQNYKKSYVKEAEGKGEQLLQYYNTPACDGQNFVKKMFDPKNQVAMTTC